MNWDMSVRAIYRLVILTWYLKIHIIWHSGTFTCSGSDWVSEGSKCYKIISGSPSDGQNQCSNEDPNASMFLAPSSIAAKQLDTML